MFGTFFLIQNRFKRIYINIGFFFKNKLKMFLKSFKIIKNVKKKFKNFCIIFKHIITL